MHVVLGVNFTKRNMYIDQGEARTTDGGGDGLERQGWGYIDGCPKEAMGSNEEGPFKAHSRILPSTTEDDGASRQASEIGVESEQHAKSVNNRQRDVNTEQAYLPCLRHLERPIDGERRRKLYDVVVESGSGMSNVKKLAGVHQQAGCHHTQSSRIRESNILQSDFEKRDVVEFQGQVDITGEMGDNDPQKVTKMFHRHVIRCLSRRHPDKDSKRRMIRSTEPGGKLGKWSSRCDEKAGP
ncbi:hypothetical protein C8J57DRAFT_1230765 [Mycena rebaudengoi]|nr:hypothetical protein C8J57DRAFT_1230765 [Mycena rebaudengoi]